MRCYIAPASAPRAQLEKDCSVAVGKSRIIAALLARTKLPKWAESSLCLLSTLPVMQIPIMGETQLTCKIQVSVMGLRNGFQFCSLERG